ncbi:Inactive pancreatic lipase-related protein 1 [Holothuria leucospilota]|uniref:Inactive pancreatic lipase-related protein 1 n=1 Tax=Holothuria leucospilota TaxID=206669 RepID=A0A9Q0YDN4_HOLLE|nr:Inactive pancreatic lipase-related protein 1 [Holothuria leucospilota]
MPYKFHSSRKVGVTLFSSIPVAADRVCYPDLGCFNNLPPFLDIPNRPVSPLPESREEVGTEFVLNTPANNFDFEYDVISNLVPGSLESSHFDPSLETKILVHGYGESGYSDWITAMGRAFLTVGDYNIIRVDWFKGAFEFYPTATSNGRLVGAEISLLMDNIAAVYPNTVAANAANYHIIGYSLGAHVAGYAGERQPNLARITALDPSSPYFENTATQVRLDETDAAFVDVIHTDTDPRIQRGEPNFQGEPEKQCLKEYSALLIHRDDTGHYEPGATYTFYIFTEDYPGNILHLGFSWLYDRDWYKPWTWPVFSTPDVYIDNIKVELLEDSSRYLSACHNIIV